METSINTLTIQQMIVFLTVVEENGFAKAATVLHMTQSAISKSIAKLEKELEITLFIRSTRHLELTDPGRFLYEEWKMHLSALQSSYQRALRMEKEKNQILRLGLMNTARPERYFDPLIQVFRQKHPDIHIEIESQYMNDLEIALDKDQFDAVFMADFKRFNIKAHHKSWCYAAKSNAYLLMSAKHPLAGKKSLRSEELRDLKFFTVGASEADSDYLLDLSDRLRPWNITPHISYRFKTAYDIRYLFRPDDAVLMIDAYFDYPENSPDIVRIPIVDQENGVICAWSPSNRNPSLEKFLKTLPYYENSNS